MKQKIVILHGWGAESASFTEVKKLLEKEGYAVDVPDLPGFGSAPLLKNPMTFDDYIGFVTDRVLKEKVILIGHSFGGRIAIAYAARNPLAVSKLILTGASGVPHPLLLKQQLVTYVAKGGKILLKAPVFSSIMRKLVYLWIGEWDYYLAGKLKETFKNVYRVDVRPFLSKISCSTLLIWGEHDFVTPVSDGEYMKKTIRGATMLVIKGAGHKLPYQMPHVFVENILPFLKG